MSIQGYNEIESRLVFGDKDDFCFKCGRPLNKKESYIRPDGKMICYSLNLPEWKLCDILSLLFAEINKKELTLTRMTKKRLTKTIESMI